MGSGPELPSGTVTFLFTDIEGSTRLLKQLRERYAEALAEHQRILRETFSEHDGREIDTQGDSFFVAFRRAKDAVGAAAAGQRALSEQPWPDGTELRVRMGIHTGEPAVGGDRYVGLGVHRAARICAAGHGGQVLVSQTTRELLRDDPQPDVSLRDLGDHQLKDLDEPERIYQLVAPGLQESFAPLKTAAPAPFEGREGELAEAAAQELAGPWWRQRGLLVAAAVVVAAAATVLGVLLTRGGGSASASGSVAANAVGVIDPKSGEIVSEIPVGAAPGGVAAAKDAIWVTNADDHSVSRIDPATNDLRDTIQVGGGPAGVAVGGGDAWVANGLDGTVSRIDRATNQVVQTITVGNGPSGIAYGEGAVWVANSADGTVSRVNSDGRVTKTLPVAVGVAGVAVGFDRVWVVSGSEGRVLALDPRTGRVEQRIGVGVDPAAIAAGSGAIWVANRADGTVSRIDPRANAVTDTIQVGSGPDGVAAGTSGVWVSNGKDGTLSLVDPSRGSVVKTVKLANPPQGLAVAPQGVYVAVRSLGAEHRGGTLYALSRFGLDSIDPAVAYSPRSWRILLTTNDGLLGFRRVGGIQGIQLVPDLAVSLPTATDDGKTYTFRLRSGIRYSNGSPVEPENFRWAIERMFEVKPPSPGAHFYSGIVGAARCRTGRRCDLSRGIVTDRVARTVSIRLTAPDAEFLDKLALPFAFLVPSGTPARDTGSRPLPATGPYVIAAYRKGRSLRLTRNPEFHEWSADAQPDGYPDAIVWRFGPSAAKAARMVEGGAADYSSDLRPELPKARVEAIATRYPSQLHVNTAAATSHFFLNTRVPPFDDVRVRRAVNMAFDREAFVHRTGSPLAAAPTCQLLPPASPGFRRYCPYAPARAASLDAARRLVRSSGTVGARVVVWVPRPIAVQGRYMASVLGSLGYRARVKTVRLVSASDIVAYFNQVGDSRVRAQTGYYTWSADYPSAASFLRDQFSCGAFVPASPQRSSNISEFCNRRIDAEIAHATAVQAHDPPAAALLWQKVERDILVLAPVVPTSNLRNVDFVSKRVGNFQYNPQWGFLVAQAWVK